MLVKTKSMRRCTIFATLIGCGTFNQKFNFGFLTKRVMLTRKTVESLYATFTP